MNAISAIKIELYDNEMELIESYTGSNVVFYKPLLKETYHLKLNYVNTNFSGNMNINILVHSHTYTTYEQADYGHLATCYCEYTTTLSHVYHDPYTWLDYNQHKATCG